MAFLRVLVSFFHLDSFIKFFTPPILNSIPYRPVYPSYFPLPPPPLRHLFVILWLHFAFPKQKNKEYKLYPYPSSLPFPFRLPTTLLLSIQISLLGETFLQLSSFNAVLLLHYSAHLHPFTVSSPSPSPSSPLSSISISVSIKKDVASSCVLCKAAPSIVHITLLQRAPLSFELPTKEDEQECHREGRSGRNTEY